LIFTEKWFFDRVVFWWVKKTVYEMWKNNDSLSSAKFCVGPLEGTTRKNGCFSGRPWGVTGNDCGFEQSFSSQQHLALAATSRYNRASVPLNGT
jgi:hypothetical protein